MVDSFIIDWIVGGYAIINGSMVIVTPAKSIASTVRHLSCLSALSDPSVCVMFLVIGWVMQGCVLLFVGILSVLWVMSIVVVRAIELSSLITTNREMDRYRRAVCCVGYFGGSDLTLYDGCID